jgi:hypothetical protein
VLGEKLGRLAGSRLLLHFAQAFHLTLDHELVIRAKRKTV